MGEHAIDQPAPLNFYGKKHPRISATGAHRIDDGAGRKNRASAGFEIGGGDGQRDAQFFKGMNLQGLFEKSGHAIGAGEAEARKSPAGESGKTNFVGDFFQFRDGESAAISGAHDRANAGARNHADRDALFFENFEDADVRDAASEASAEGDADGRCAMRICWNRPAGKFAAKGLHGPNNLAQTLHKEPHVPIPQEPGLLEGGKPYLYYVRCHEAGLSNSPRWCYFEVTVELSASYWK